MPYRLILRSLAPAAIVIAAATMAPPAFALPDVPCAVSSDSPPTCVNGGAFCRLSNRPGQCQTTSLGCACGSASPLPGLLQVIHTGCTPSGNHATFSFSLLNTSSVAICEVHLVPTPFPPVASDSCQIYSCGAPAPWLCVGPTTVSGPRGASFVSLGNTACIPAGGQLGLFSVEMSLPGCCYDIVVRDEAGTYYEAGIVCFDCGPTPSLRQSWGRVKSIYR